MAHVFAPINAKPAFGSFKQNLYQSDYINRKKGKIIYCKAPAYCNKIKVSNNYENVNLYNLGRYSLTRNNVAVNKYNLVMGQYTKSNLDGICTVIPTPPCTDVDYCEPCALNEPVPINITSTDPFFWNNTIDPLGELYGASQCGELNYVEYMVLDPSLTYN
jgi:hypothetical protein